MRIGEIDNLSDIYQAFRLLMNNWLDLRLVQAVKEAWEGQGLGLDLGVFKIGCSQRIKTTLISHSLSKFRARADVWKDFDEAHGTLGINAFIEL